jgi:hypothetical protein
MLIAGAAWHYAHARDHGLDTESAWPMHPVDDRFRGANALGPGDVNQDGFIDYVTNYEFDQRYVITLHPGVSGNFRRPWPAVTAWKPKRLLPWTGVNPENAALGDFDGDGNLDVAAAQGWSRLAFWEGSEPGIRMVWGPPPDRVMDESAWSDGGRIPATIDRGHLIYVVPHDVNRDGATDIVSGGRVHGGNQRKGGVIWIEAPSNQADRRDLSKWAVHDIDPDQYSAHGLALTDIDADGDKDIALANADFDTPEDEEKVLWYENPGKGAPAQKGPWPIHVIYRGSEFYGKPQIATADLDGDGLEDLFTQTAQDIYWFRKTGVGPVSWEMVRIEKAPAAQWLSRPVRVVDLNGDGRLDLVGMLVHEDRILPGDKAAAFWMEYRGDKPRADNWTTHVIKWGSGRMMRLSMFGEKWDQANFADVDRDGDLDIVANCEEWWVDEGDYRFFWNRLLDPISVSVVWFENRLGEEPYVFEEAAGLLVIETENFSWQGGGDWVIRARYPGYSGDGYVQAANSQDTINVEWEATRGLEYNVKVEGGSYHVWLRRWITSEWSRLGSFESNSALIGADGKQHGGIFDNNTDYYDQWFWLRAPDPLTLSPGAHTINLRVREGGYAVDRILMTRDPALVPSGAGPDAGKFIH